MRAQYYSMTMITKSLCQANVADKPILIKWHPLQSCSAHRLRQGDF
jgi:hypothetical protein